MQLGKNLRMPVCLSYTTGEVSIIYPISFNFYICNLKVHRILIPPSLLHRACGSSHRCLYGVNHICVYKVKNAVSLAYIDLSQTN